MHGIQRGARYKVTQEPTVIGRSRGADIQLNDVGISRHHARVIWENSDNPKETPRCFLEDMESRNGTELNGRVINRRVQLRERDRITLGRTTLVLAFRDQEEILHDQDLYQSATRDGLTGLDNRQQLSYVLRHLLSSSARRRVALSMLLIDIDHFKQINDTHGHTFGDGVLKSLADVLVSCLRTSDLACRWGGEEFVISLPNTAKEQAIEVAERIRIKVEEMKIPLDDKFVKLTISVGVSEARHSDSVQSLFDRADHRLYLAKSGGRNRVCAFDDTPVSQLETNET
ncbi:MAG: GGDEF domain-containing protein [Candidatus Sumerlaeia bacterium]|nr:GGDEF domain-containing protein [Candidatus Sumerlaeia bacterium]